MEFIVTLLVAVALVIIYMFKVAHEHNVLQHTVQVKGKQDEIKIIFISDVHNRIIASKDTDQLKKADAVIIGGDFCDRRTSEKTLLQNIAYLSSLGPVYFVWGNNDREFGEERLRAIFSKYGVVVIENDAVQLDNRPNTTWIAAIDDTSTRNYSFQDALAKCGQQHITFCVSHNPQVFYLARKEKNIALLMGGHLHGGQIRLGKFGLHPNGSFSIRHGVATLISNGYGTSLLPLRLGAKPQLHVIHVRVNETNEKVN